MMRSYLKFGMMAVALIGMSATIASAGNLGLVDNGDMELESRFAPHGTPGVDHPNGFADAWHHGGEAAWSNGTTDPTTSGSYSLWLPDTLISAESEMRSFAGDSACCATPTGSLGAPHRTGNLPGVGSAGRVLEVSWEWDWDITSDPTHVFTATIRTSDVVGTGLDLDTGPSLTETFVFSGTGSSGGFVSESVAIPLSAAAAQWDIIFNTSDRTAPDFGGRLDATGVLFVDDVFARIPEPASLLLLSISGLMVMGRRQRG